MTVDPRAPCLIGAGQLTVHPDEFPAPEPLEMWAEVARQAADDSGAAKVLSRLDSVQVVYCQSWPYDDPPARLAAALGADPGHTLYAGIGGTRPQQLIDDTATSILAGETDLALVVGGEALWTRRQLKKQDQRPDWSHRDPEKRPFPFEAPFHPAEVAHEVFQAWLTFALFDIARRARLGLGVGEHRKALGELMAPLSHVAATNPGAWFGDPLTVDELITQTAENRMVGYPYTKRMVAVMDVDMAAGVLVASHAMADELGVPAENRVYLRGWCYATDQTYVAEHPDLTRSPAMAAASTEALRVAGVGLDDVAHLDLYSCFASSLDFARDALGIGPDDTRPLTVTGGLPFHGGPGSNYMTHAVAEMVKVLRADPGSVGMVSGVGMHMTKHVFGLYSTEPGAVSPPDEARVQAALDETTPLPITATHEGPATVATYSVVHGRDGEPQWGLAVCDLADRSRCYARVDDPDQLLTIERSEWVGAQVSLSTQGEVNSVLS